MKTLRFAVVGAGRVAGTGTGRGKTFTHAAEALPGAVELVAVCDLDEQTCDEWRARGDVRVYNDYQKLLEDPEVDAVCLATPVLLHARQAIDALNAGKHVLSEVPGSYDLQDCFDLVEAVERTGLTYMLAENYCFMRDVMMVSEMARRGVFGEMLFASGDYLHDCRDLFFQPDGSLTWRGDIHRSACSNTYPTHSLGPVCQWLGINRGDRLKSLGAWGSPALAGADYVARNYGAQHELAARDAWKLPNTVVVMLNTEKGVLAEHRLDWSSPRPHHMNRYALQGTRASFTSSADPHLEPLIWIQDRSETSKTGVAGNWEPLWKYADEYEHPFWKSSGEKAAAAGHGGGDYFVLREFSDAVREGRLPMIDVYDSALWSSVIPLSSLSLEQGGAPVAVPDFKKNVRF
jgi:predicted dehydrogenase